MKIAIVFNRESRRVINLFGLPNREKYGLAAIQRIAVCLRKGGHQVKTFEGDKDLIDRLEEYMPRVMKHERPGMVFNLSYGIQGQARYTHVPGMLEMIGLPYVGSGPLAHSLALDKVVSKMIFLQHGLPTPDFAVLDAPGFDVPELKFPMIVKPKNEAVSFGIRIVRSEKQLREAADVIFVEFEQPVLVEQYIAGREINVGLLGNRPVETLPPAEIKFGRGGPKIYTMDDKKRTSGREIEVACPARLPSELAGRAQEIALRAFRALGCYDCARVDMRLDKNANLYILEVNSLPSLGEHGSFVRAAAEVGLDFSGLINRLVDVATARYFGTTVPPEVVSKEDTNGKRIVGYLSSQRDAIEKRVQQWTRIRSRTSDPVGIDEAWKLLDAQFGKLGFRAAESLGDPGVAQTWETPAGLEGGVLVIGHLDIPLEPGMTAQMFRREPEFLYGEGIGVSRAPLVSLQFALQALRRTRRLRKLKMGVLYYADEGHDCRYSAETIRKAASKARCALVLRPGNVGDHIVTVRRGQRRYRLTFSGEAVRLGRISRKPRVLPWALDKLQQCTRLSSRKDRLSVATLDVRVAHMPMLLPHKVTAVVLTSYPSERSAESLDGQIREILKQKGIVCKVELLSTRPALKERRATVRMAKALQNIAAEWDIPLKRESSVWPSVAGLVPAPKGVICGLGPVASDIYTPNERVDRMSLLQRTLLLAEYLSSQIK